MKNETNVDPYVKWDNTCIKVLSKEHGAKVIEFWKSVGVNTMFLDGDHVYYYYGIFDGNFNYWSDELHLKNKRILTLEEAIAIRDSARAVYVWNRDSETKSFPREMYVWDCNSNNSEKEVIVYICSDEELKKYNRTKRYIGLTLNYENAMEIEEYEAMMKKENEDAKMKEWVSKVEHLLLEVKPLVEREMLKYMNEDLRSVLNHAKEFIEKSDELKNKL